MDPRLLLHDLAYPAYAAHRAVTAIAASLRDQASSAGYGDYVLLARSALIYAAVVLALLQIQAAAAGRHASAVLRHIPRRASDKNRV